MFTKQHYERVAQTLLETKRDAGKATDAQVTNFAVNEARAYIAQELADMFAEDNPQFKRILFYKAAGVWNYIAQENARKDHERMTEKCIRCGEGLDMTFPDLAETGVCANCWTEEDEDDVA